jgi:hypothetical protein
MAPHGTSPKCVSTAVTAVPAATTPKNAPEIGDLYASVIVVKCTVRPETKGGESDALEIADLYASVIAVECATRTRDEKAMKPVPDTNEAMHLRSPSLCICHSGRMHHQYQRRTGGEAAPDAGENDAPEIADLYASFFLHIGREGT